MATTSCYQPYICHSHPGQSNAISAEVMLSLRSLQSSVSYSLSHHFLPFISSWNTYSAPWFPSQRPKLTRWRQGLASLHALLVFHPGCQLTSEYGSSSSYTPFQEPIHFSHSRSWNWEKCAIFINKKHFLAFMCAKENSAITCECSYRLPQQAAAGTYFSLVIVFIQHHCFSRLDSWFFNAAKASISDHELWEVLMIYYTNVATSACDAEPFSAVSRSGLLCVSAEPCPTHSCPSQPSPSRTHVGHSNPPWVQKQGSVLLLKGIHENFCLWHIHGDRVLPKTHTKGINPPEIWILFASYQNIHSKPRRHSTAKHWQEEMLIKH